jgi:hypothetical protein
LEDLFAQKRSLISLNLEVRFLSCAGADKGGLTGAANGDVGGEALRVVSQLNSLVDQLYRRWDDLEQA